MEESEYTISLADLTSGFTKELFTSERFGDTFVALVRTQYLTSTIVNSGSSAVSREEPSPEEYVAVPLPIMYLDYKLFQSNGVGTTLSDLVALDIPFYLDPASPSDDTDLLEDVYVVNIPVELTIIHILLVATQPILGPLAQSLDILEALHTANAEEVYKSVIEDARLSLATTFAVQLADNTHTGVIPCLRECSEMDDLTFLWQEVKPLPEASLARLISLYRAVSDDHTLPRVIRSEEARTVRQVSKEVQAYIDQVPVTGDETWILEVPLSRHTLRVLTGLSKIDKAWSREFLLPNTFLVGKVITGGLRDVSLDLYIEPKAADDLSKFREHLDTAEDSLSSYTVERYEGQVHFEANFTSGQSFEGLFYLVEDTMKFIVETTDEVELERATQKVRALIMRSHDPEDLIIEEDSIFITSVLLLVSVEMGSRYDSLRSPFPLERGYLGSEGLRITKTCQLARSDKECLFYPDDRLVDYPHTLRDPERLARSNLSSSDRVKLLEGSSTLRDQEAFGIIMDVNDTLLGFISGAMLSDVIQNFRNVGTQYDPLENGGIATFYDIEEPPSWYKSE